MPLNGVAFSRLDWVMGSKRKEQTAWLSQEGTRNRRDFDQIVACVAGAKNVTSQFFLKLLTFRIGHEVVLYHYTQNNEADKKYS